MRYANKMYAMALACPHENAAVNRFPIRRDGTAVVVAVDRVFRSDQSLPAGNAAVVDVS